MEERVVVRNLRWLPKPWLEIDAASTMPEHQTHVAASLGHGKKRDYKHHDMGLVVDLGPHQAVANPLKIPLSGFPAKVVTRAYHLYAIPRGVNRWAVALAYLTDTIFARSVISMGLATQGDAEFSTSEGIPLPETG